MEWFVSCGGFFFVVCWCYSLCLFCAVAAFAEESRVALHWEAVRTSHRYLVDPASSHILVSKILPPSKWQGFLKCTPIRFDTGISSRLSSLLFFSLSKPQPNNSGLSLLSSSLIFTRGWMKYTTNSYLFPLLLLLPPLFVSRSQEFGTVNCTCECSRFLVPGIPH